MKKYLIWAVLVVVLAGCAQIEDLEPTPTPPMTGEAETTEGGTTLEEAAATSEARDTTAESDLAESALPVIEPIEVLFFTPAQQEGPYYPLEKPADHDNDLVDFASAAGEPKGQILHLAGIVYDSSGLPVEGITIEIWQTDSQGVYLHPQDPSVASHDPNFQFYGESVTDADGVYSFRTILPGLYEPRPRHIHVKVKWAGEELLTTQFYFVGEIELQGPDAAMLITTAPAEDDYGNPVLVGERDIFLSTEIANP